MSTPLAIDALRAVEAAPNSFDRTVLAQMQENLACDVMKIYRDDLARLLQKQKASGMSADMAAGERKEFFSRRLNVEYRNRTGSDAFSLPMYLETAENRYRMEIRRHLQQVQDYVAHGKHASELHLTGSVREMRAADPGMNDMANKVAAGINGINDSLEKLSRIGKDAASRMTKDLQKDLSAGLRGIEGDPFASAVLSDAQTLAAAQRELARLGDIENTLAPKH